MRLPTVNWILLACIAIATADEPRPKRDLLYLKNLLTSKIFGSSDTSSDSTPVLIRQDGDAKIFRIPGFDDILVKAIPKANLEKIQTTDEIKVIEHPTMAILNSYLGTKTQGETLTALQGIKNLLKSGILNAQRDLFEIVPVKEACLPKPAYIPEPPIATVIPVLPPTIVPVIPVSPIDTKYSYKQKHLDGHMTTYTSKDGHDVIVNETNGPIPTPPSYIADRLQQVIVLGMKPVQAIASVIPKPVFHVPKPIAVPVPTILQAPRGDVKVSSYSYKQHHDGGVSTYLGSGQNSVVEQLAFLRPPLAYKVEEVEVSAPVQLSANLPKIPSGYRFRIVNNANSSDNLAGRLFYNTPRYYQSPEQMTKYVYKQINENTPSMVYVEDRPIFDTKGQVHVNVNSGHSNGYNQFPHLSTKINPGSGEFSYKLHHNDGSITTYSGNKIGSSMVKETVKIMPPLHMHSFDRVENAANSHEAPLAKPLSGYSFKTVNGKAYTNIANNPTTSTDRKKSSFQMETQGITGSGGYSYKQVSNDGTLLTYTATGVRPEESLVTQPNSEAKAPSGYSFKIVNNQAFVRNNGGKGQSSIDGSSSSGAYSYKQISNDGTSATYTAPGVKLEEGSVAQDNSAQKALSGYSFKIVNGNTADQVKPNIGMTSFNAGSNNVGSSMDEDHEALHIHNVDRIENAANAHEAPLAKLLAGYSFKTVNDKAYVNIAKNQATSTEQKENNSEMGTQGKSGSGGYSYKQFNNEGVSTTYMATGGSKEGNLAVQANSAGKAPSGYSFKIVNNQALVGNNGEKGQSIIGAGGAYSYKQVSNDDTPTTHFASDDVKAGKPAYFGAETNKGMPTLPAYIVNRIEKVAAQAHSADKASSGYSFKIVNGNSGDLKQQYDGMPSLNAALNANYAGSDAYSYKQENTFIPYGAMGQGEDVKSNVLMEEAIRPIPAYVIDRIENVVAQTHVADKGPSGYSFKIANGQAFVSSTNGQAESNVGMDSINQAIGANFDESSSSAGSGGYSYKLVNSAGSNSYVTRGDVGNSAVLIEETNKPIPAPPKYIVNRIENVPVQVHAAETGPSRYSFKIVNNQASYFEGNSQNKEMESVHVPTSASETNTGVSSSSGSFANSQVNNVDSLNTNAATNPTTGDQNDGSTSGYSFKLVNNQAFSSNAAGQTKPSIGMGSLDIAANANEGNEDASSSGSYSYKQIGNAGTTTVFEADQEKTGNAADLVSEINKEELPTDSAAAPNGAAVAAQTQSGYSFSIVNNVHGSHSNGDSEWKSDKHQALMFTEPIPSTYSYKQINTNNPQPFTVVRVEDGPTVETNGDLTFKVNTHEHINPDGTRYLCDERHLYGPELAENVYAENVSEVQNGYMYVPPTINEDMTEKKEETDNTQDDNSLSKNPIVVAPLDHVYSFKQTKTDGSSYNVESSSAGTVSVSVNEGDTIEGHRGDIP